MGVSQSQVNDLQNYLEKRDDAMKQDLSGQLRDAQCQADFGLYNECNRSKCTLVPRQEDHGLCTYEEYGTVKKTANTEARCKQYDEYEGYRSIQWEKITNDGPTGYCESDVTLTQADCQPNDWTTIVKCKRNY